MNQPSPTPWRAEWRTQLALALPLAAWHAGQTLMGAVDTAVVGRLGAAEIAAVGLGNAIFMGAFIMSMGVMMGLDPLISQALGAKQHARASQLVWHGGVLALLLTVLLLPLLFSTGALLRWAGIEDATAALTHQYVVWRTPGMWPALASVGCRALLQARHITRPLVTGMVAANVANALLDVLLVFGGAALPEGFGVFCAVPAYGVVGAAWASTVCTALQLGWMMLAMARAPDHGQARQQRRPSVAEIWAVVKVGLPLGLQMGAEMGVFSLVSILAGRLSTNAAAAHQIAIQVASISFCVALGASSAGSVRVGQAVGAQDHAAVRLRGLMAFAFGASFMGLMAVFYAVFPGFFARLLTSDETVVAVAVPLLRVAAVFQLADGTQAVGAGVLRGAGDTRFLGLANLVGHYAIGLPVALWLGFLQGHGITGLWWGLCTGLFAVALALAIRFWVISGKPIARLEHTPVHH
jgi:MATE family multidrug resistance protein